MAYDVIIVGGGPAGLSAAVVLGRCLRSVLVIDSGRPRNARARGVHNFLTREGMAPADLLRAGMSEAEGYGVSFLQGEVEAAAVAEGGFEVRLRDGRSERSRKLLLAGGVVDELPAVEGAAEIYGKSLWHCPYCDGWEARGKKLAVYGRGAKGYGIALGLLTWSGDVVLLTDGSAGLEPWQRSRLAEHGIETVSKRIARFQANEGQLEAVVFRDGSVLPRQGIFFETGQKQRSHLAVQLGCKFNRHGTVVTDHKCGTGIEGLYVAGDLSHDMQFVVVAAAEGVKAGVAINTDLQREDLR